MSIIGTEAGTKKRKEQRPCVKTMHQPRVPSEAIPLYHQPTLVCANTCIYTGLSPYISSSLNFRISAYSLNLTSDLLSSMFIPKFYALYACVIMLLVDLSLATQRLVPRVVQAIHHSASRRTHSLARDLRMAFGGILAPRADTAASRHVIYCKPGKQVTFGGGSGRGNPGNTSSTLSSTLSGAGRTSRRPTSTSASSKPTSTIPASSPWKLVESHVN